MNIPYISAEEVRKNLSMEDAIQCTENVYKLKSQDKTVVWPTIFYEFDPGHADMDIKSGYLPEQHIFGHKTVAFMEANVQKGLPDLVGLIAVFSSETGMPLGLVDGSSVTGMRTGAAGAIGAKCIRQELSFQNWPEPASPRISGHICRPPKEHQWSRRIPKPFGRHRARGYAHHTTLSSLLLRHRNSVRSF